MNEDNTDNLQQKLLSTRYSVIDGMKSVNNSLQEQQSKHRKNKEKVEEMQKKLSQLTLLQRKVNKQAFSYQRKLDKLEYSQDYAGVLMQLKHTEIEKRQKEMQDKKKKCKEMRESMKEKRDMSLNIFDNMKRQRIKKIKQQNFHSYLECKKRMQEEEDRRRKSSQNIKERQMIARDRMRRYEQFKLKQAQSNYDFKRQHEVARYNDQKVQLKELKQKEREEEQIFRKTQVLNKETSRIESIYLTSQG